MRPVSPLSAALIVCSLSWSCSSPQPSPLPSSPTGKAIRFLAREVPAWKRDNGCFSCHNNGDGARALFVAQPSLPFAPLTETLDWLRQPSAWNQNKGDAGSSDPKLAHLQFTHALWTAHRAGFSVPTRSLDAALDKLATLQDADGKYPIEGQGATGSPTSYGPVLATAIAARILESRPAHITAAARAKAWLLQQPRDNTVTMAAVFPWASTAEKRTLLASFSASQTSDGGWGPYPASPPEIFDTALVLLALKSEPGALTIRARARTFLQQNQNPDGSWNATTRPSGGQSYAQQISTTAWATLALLATET